MCGCVCVWTEGGVREEMQQQWGEGFAARLAVHTSGSAPSFLSQLIDPGFV